MSTTYRYILDFSAKNNRFLASMKKSSQSVDKVNKKVAASKSMADKASKSFGNLKGMIAGAFAIGAVVSFAKQSLAAYDVQAKAETGLLVALKGRVAVQQRLMRQASELQKKTLFGDEETIKAQSLIAAFVKEGDQIERIIPLVQDLATAKSMDLSAAADLVSKTLGSSTNAMSRYGIEVEGAVGSTERLESLVNNLSDAFGGQAEAAAAAGTGGLKQLANAYGDIQEAMGKIATESDSFSKYIEGSKNELIDLATILGADNLSGWQKFSKALFGDLDKNAKSVRQFQDLQAGAASAVDLYDKMISGATTSTTENSAATIKQITTFGDLKTQIAEKTALLEKADIADTSYIKKIYSEIDALEKQKTAFESLSKIIKQRETIPAGLNIANSIETKKSTTVEGPAKVDTSTMADMSPLIDRQLEKIEQLKTGWSSFGEQFDSIMQMMMERGKEITGVHMLAADMVGGLMGIAQQGVSGLKEWASAVKDAAMSAINAFIAEGVAGAVSKTLSFLPFPINMVLGAAAAAGATALLSSVIPSFTMGGMVPGTSFHGDQVLIRANSGEELLTRNDPRHSFNQQGTLQANTARDRLIIPTVKIRKGDIYIAYNEASREIGKRT